jgi:spoIIIJ-associated protein
MPATYPGTREAETHEAETHEAETHEAETRQAGSYDAGVRSAGDYSEEPEMSPDQLQSVASEHTQNLLRAMGFEATVSARAEGTSVEVKAEVPREGDLLVGPKGEVRQALQHLLNRMINRDQGSRYHLQLEVNDFWQQREQELQNLARSLADEAVADGREKLTEYLNAQERRIVHVTLIEDERVRTHAIGDGLIKKISIAPTQAAESPQESEASEATKYGE